MADLIERARREGAPLIDGETVTFVYQGKRPPALIADFTDWEATPVSLEKAGRGVWIHRAEFPRNAYLEYAFLYTESGERLLDPLNPHTTPNGFGEHNNYFFMPEARPTELTHRRPGVPQGKVTRHDLRTEKMLAGAKRRVYLYQPPVEDACPLVVVYDGQDYLRRGKLPQIVDHLIYQGRIRPVALAMVAHAGEARAVEYACSEMVLDFLISAVLPLAHRELNLIGPGESDGRAGVLGASMGGLMALYTGLRLPELFGSVLSQSAAIRLEDYTTVVVDLARYGPVQPLNIWMDVGKFEWLLDADRQMCALLQERGYPVVYREYPGGHNYTSWRNDVWGGLECLFPPQENQG